jgi:hypothetical protein
MFSTSRQNSGFSTAVPAAPSFVLLLFAVAISLVGCGRRASNYGLTDAASSNAVLKQGQTLCGKGSCPRLDITLNVEVASPFANVPGSTVIQVPAGKQTQMRFSTRLSEPTVTRQAAMLVKQVPPFVQPGTMSPGSITMVAAPEMGSSGTIEFRVRDLTYCEVTSQNKADCKNASVPNDSDKTITYTITGVAAQGQAGGAFVLPSESRCVKPPSELEQTVGGLQQAISIGSALLKGNFIPVITNIAGGLSAGAQADRQGARQGC